MNKRKVLYRLVEKMIFDLRKERIYVAHLGQENRIKGTVKEQTAEMLAKPYFPSSTLSG